MTKKDIFHSCPTTSRYLPKHVSAELVIQRVADHFNLPEDKLKAKTRKRAIVQPRMVAMYLMRNHTPLALKKIGEHFIGDKRPAKDHTTVVHACNTLRDLMKTDENLRKSVHEIQSTL